MENQLEVQVPKWISVEDRLPEDDQDVLVCVNKSTIDTGFCSFGHDPSVRNWYAYAVVSNNVTHWMPLPEPPKENEGGNDGKERTAAEGMAEEGPGSDRC